MPPVMKESRLQELIASVPRIRHRTRSVRDNVFKRYIEDLRFLLIFGMSQKELFLYSITPKIELSINKRLEKEEILINIARIQKKG